MWRFHRLRRTRFSTDNERQPHGPGPKPLKDIMQSVTHSKPTKALSRPSSKRQQQEPTSAWRPQAAGLTREEIRAIVIDQIG